MNRSRELLLALCLLSLAAMVVFFLTRRPHITCGPPLPAGKVEPRFSGDLFLAPDGTLWKISYTSTGGASPMTFAPFIPGNDWISLSGSHHSGMAIKEDGTLWSWLSRYPESGRPASFDPPAQLGSDRDWAQVRYGWKCALLLKRDGSLWYLGGSSVKGNRGLEQLEPGMLPVRVGSDNDWVAMETNIDLVHYALKRDGTLWYWGAIAHGVYEATPHLLNAEPEWSRMSVGTFFMAAVRRDGTLWVHGGHSSIVARDFASGSTSGPFQVGPDTDWVNVASGGNSSVAQKADGSWWASGENHYAQLGLPHWFGHSRHLTKPTRIPIDLDAWAWHIEEYTTTILTRDGSFHYMGKRPGSRPTTGVVTSVQEAVNRASYRIPGMPRLFASPGEDWSQTPVRMGELPPSVIATLRSK